MSLRHLKRVFVSFTPGDLKAVSAREFLQRITGDKAKKSNPGCAVEFDVAEDGQPGQAFIDLTFNDDTQRKLFTADTPVTKITEMIERKGVDLEMQAVMNEVKFVIGHKQEK